MPRNNNCHICLQSIEKVRFMFEPVQKDLLILLNPRSTFVLVCDLQKLCESVQMNRLRRTIDSLQGCSKVSGYTAFRPDICDAYGSVF